MSNPGDRPTSDRHPFGKVLSGLETDGPAPAANQSSWGWDGRHYAEDQHRATGARSHSKPTESEKRWAELLEQATPGVSDTVERAFKQWNNIIREQLRTETALRLTVGEDVRAVPVRIVAGMPRFFADVVRQFQGLEWLLLNRPLVDSAAKGTKFLEGTLTHVVELYYENKLPTEEIPPSAELERVRRLAESLIQILDKAEVMKKIAGINEDVLGAYFFKLPEIRLYWMVIGIVAATIGVSPENLTVVVLAHELAHAYTHLGRDIDSERWDTQAFAAAELSIVEGLAQFYTATVCKRLQPRMPSVWEAYERLLEIQSGPYRAHENWIEKDESGGEIVRVAMIECRSRKIAKATDFLAAITNQRSQVRGRGNRPQPVEAKPAN